MEENDMKQIYLSPNVTFMTMDISDVLTGSDGISQAVFAIGSEDSASYNAIFKIG